MTQFHPHSHSAPCLTLLILPLLYHTAHPTGTFPTTRRLFDNTVAIHPAHIRRFDAPWLLHPPIQTRSLSSSGFRILYSPIREQMSDGIGHAITVLNAEVSIALQLDLTYTHRLAKYQTVDRNDPFVMETLFATGRDELPRRFLDTHVCHVRRISNRGPMFGSDACPICHAIRQAPVLPVTRIVQIPDHLLYGCTTCYARQSALMQFMRHHANNHSIFQMSPLRCDSMPKSPDFQLSLPFFYWKYWDFHADPRAGRMTGVRNRYLSFAPYRRRSRVQLDERELSIAIHARRGDFFHERKRRMVPCSSFARVVSHVMHVVRHTGGVFADMPVAVYVFAEGRRVAYTGATHDIAQMDDVFVDVEQIPRDAAWFLQLLVQDDVDVAANATHTDMWTGWPFMNGVRTEFRISRQLDVSIHEMASADVFIGSESDLSQYAVRVISRAGLQLLPHYMGNVPGCCTVRFDVESGHVEDLDLLRRYWFMYVTANEQSALRAMNT